MNMRSPIVAMLWENWRLTRVEIAQRLGIGVAAGAAALVFLDAGAAAAFWILIVLNGMCALLSILKLNGGRFMDGYKPGFPFYLLYTRPIPTVLFVSVAMAYEAFTCVALYVVSAAALGIAFGQPLPLLSVTAWILAFHSCYLCVQWATRHRVVQWVGSIAFSLPLFFLLKNNFASPSPVGLSITEDAVMVLICAATFGLTVAGVARQRRGDSVVFEPQPKAGSVGYPDWLVNLFRFPCPTSSPTRAQVWFEFKSSGLPVLLIGFGVAILIFLLCALSILFGELRVAAIPVTIFALPIVLFGLGGNAFGIRRKQGRTYASAFELTQPYGSAQVAGLKVLVRAACVLIALIAISASLWASSLLVGDWGHAVMNNNQDAAPALLKIRQKFAEAFGAPTGYTYAALAVVASIAVAGVVAWQATREAIRTRHPRILLAVQWLPAVWGLSIILLTFALRKGFGPVPLVGQIVAVTFWISGAAMLLATIYLLWNGFAKRVLTTRYALGAFVISIAFGAAWLTCIPGHVVEILWPVLLFLMVILLAPWAFSRVRHQ
jgi:hypothetical protein